MFRNYRKCSCMNNSYRDNDNNSRDMENDMMETVSPYVPGQSMEEINFIKKTNKIGKGCNQCR